MKNFICYIFIIASIVVITFIFLRFHRDSKAASSFLGTYGWEVSGQPTESEDVTIPDEFDDVYISYNQLQKDAGLDLTPYRGRKGTRYTFSVTNYPDENVSDVRANVIVISGVPVAGDISTVAFDGFMHSLSAKTADCISPAYEACTP